MCALSINEQVESGDHMKIYQHQTKMLCHENAHYAEYRLFYRTLLQKIPIILRSLLIVKRKHCVMKMHIMLIWDGYD